MTKDWDVVRSKIRELSVDQKLCLQDVKSIMEEKHQFRASTRAYRMKLKEWGYMRHRPRKTTKNRSKDIGAKELEEEGEFDREVSAESEESAVVVGGDPALADEAQDLLPAIDPRLQAHPLPEELLMQMLEAILEGDGTKMEQKLMLNPNIINNPIGLPFDAIGGPFFNHPAIQPCVMLQHPGQTLLDIASALPSGPCIWMLIYSGAKGSTHPLGTDLALQNAIKNDRTLNVRGLINHGISTVAGNPETLWRPLLQAAFWNVPDIVKLLLDRGAEVNEVAPASNAIPCKTALQLSLHHRAKHYSSNSVVRERSERILLTLLNAGADIHVSPAEDFGLTAFEMFIKPWQSDPSWAASLDPTAGECLEAFIRKGADLRSSFSGFPCSSPSARTFLHQVLWHSTPVMARLVVELAAPTLDSDGSSVLHEIVGCCLLAKRHPSDTLRDIEVLLQKGANPNLANKNGLTPLTTCIKFCPSIDIVDRLSALLEGGADPTVDDISLAARSFEEPQLSKVMHLLLSHFQRRRISADQYIWIEGYLPIPRDPTFSQVLWYSGLNDDFEVGMQRMLPKDAISVFRDAAFSVASKNYLDALTKRATLNQEVRLAAKEKDEMQTIFRLRQARNIFDYHFGHDFVMGLVMA